MRKIALDEWKDNLHHLSSFTHSTQFLLLVSGGIDSMVLSHLFLKAQLNFQILHINYNLRSEDSVSDAAHVQSWSLENDIPCTTYEAHKPSDTTNTQLWARNLRLTHADRLKSKLRIDWICTAHHLDDRIETFFINLIRGTHIGGLSSIQPKRDWHLKPLLHYTKDAILDYATNNHITYRIDKSNDADDYLRNRIRHQIIPFIARESLSYQKKFRKTMDHLDGISEYLDTLITTPKLDDPIILHLEQVPDGLLHNTKLLKHLLRTHQFSDRQISQIAHGQDVSNLQLCTSAGRYLLHYGILLRFDPIVPVDVLIHGADLPLDITVHHQRVTFTKERNYEMELGYMMELSLVSWPIKLRSWKQGDAFTPYGMMGKRKKVSALFKDKKLSLIDRQKSIVIEDQNGILGVLPYRWSSYRLKPNSNSDHKLYIHYT